ncbi:uncharacterized protein F4822DRAFT_444992 [Hypoxylon trugodes]|uniref:uncharacterized protein n=1 Tax=Hypoxylon trugodes TaxID=326681 RepID=UPI002194F34C|nr:uncharacterized protein F4822DRAFT_444992 [Hypoxylon trugodes]KAI1386678.1 hypothetical protein F4822DRAFT_444992 [Hypoxylon trugodes]
MPSSPSIARLSEIPNMPSSADPISSGSTNYQPLSSARIASLLPDRTESRNFDGGIDSGGNEAARPDSHGRRGRSVTPVRANVKRKRSVASAPGDTTGQLLRRSSSTASVTGHDSNLYNNTNTKDPPRRPNTPHQRNISRGRSSRRKTPDTNDVETRKRRKVDGKDGRSREPPSGGAENIKKSFKVTKGSDALVIQQLSLSSTAEHNNEEIAYERKGAFRLKKNKRVGQFRFPKSKSQPEPLWRAGDGFTGDEARPDFVFPMARLNKQRSRSLPGVGKLQLETENESTLEPSGLRSDRPKATNLSQLEMKRRRGPPKDVWPTRDNFTEELAVRKRNPTVPEGETIIPSTVPFRPAPSPHVRETYSYNRPSTLKRKHSDFENFGQRLRNGDKLGSMIDIQSRPQQVHHMGYYEPADGGEHEDGERDEAEEDEIVPCSVYSGELSMDEETSTGYRESSGASPDRQSSTDESAMPAAGSERELQEAKSYSDGIGAAGEIAREVLPSS